MPVQLVLYVGDGLPAGATREWRERTADGKSRGVRIQVVGIIDPPDAAPPDGWVLAWRCSRCRKVKPREDFSVDRSRGDPERGGRGLQGNCKGCVEERR